MKRIIKILTLFLLFPVFLMQEGCKPKECKIVCQRMPFDGMVIIKHSNVVIPYQKYKVHFIETDRTNLNTIIDTTTFEVIPRSKDIRFFIASPDGPNEPFYDVTDTTSLLVGIASGTLTPNNYIIVMDTIRDTLFSIAFSRNPRNCCTPEDVTNVSLWYNGKFFSVDGQTLVINN